MRAEVYTKISLSEKEWNFFCLTNNCFSQRKPLGVKFVLKSLANAVQRFCRKRACLNHGNLKIVKNLVWYISPQVPRRRFWRQQLVHAESAAPRTPSNQRASMKPQPPPTNKPGIPATKQNQFSHFATTHLRCTFIVFFKFSRH